MNPQAMNPQAMNLQDANTKQQLASIIRLANYRVVGAKATIATIDGQADAVVEFPSSGNGNFWVTDMIASVVDAEGNEVLEANIPSDDLSVTVTINDRAFTYNYNAPVSAFAKNSNESEMYMGHIIAQNDKMTFRFSANRWANIPQNDTNNQGVLSKYPLFFRVTVKGYAF
jgi:hypothetical protein